VSAAFLLIQNSKGHKSLLRQCGASDSDDVSTLTTEFHCLITQLGAKRRGFGSPTCSNCNHDVRYKGKQLRNNKADVDERCHVCFGGKFDLILLLYDHVPHRASLRCRIATFLRASLCRITWLGEWAVVHTGGLHTAPIGDLPRSCHVCALITGISSYNI